MSTINKTTINILLLVIVAVVDFIGLGIVLTTFVPLFLSPHGIFPYAISTIQRQHFLGLALAMAPLGQLFATPVLGALSDMYGRKKLLIITLSGTGISMLMTA